MGLCCSICSLNFDFHANRSQIMRKIPTKTTQIVASRESPVLAAALHTQCRLGALTCGICQERRHRGIWWRHYVQLDKSGSKSVGCTLERAEVEHVARTIPGAHELQQSQKLLKLS